MGNKKGFYSRKQLLLLLDILGWKNPKDYPLVKLLEEHSRKRYHADRISYYLSTEMKMYLFDIKYEDLPLYINKPMLKNESDIIRTRYTYSLQESTRKAIVKWRLQIGK